jgi:hypothetical protein
MSTHRPPRQRAAAALTALALVGGLVTTAVVATAPAGAAARTAQTITFSPPPATTYGTAPVAVSATASSGLPVDFSVAGGTCTISGSTVTVVKAGTCKVTASQPGDVTYKAAASVSRAMSIAKAPLSVTPDDVSRLFGAPNPTFTGTVVGILHGDPITATYATTAKLKAPIGVYAINATLHDVHGELANYTGTRTAGTLHVVNAASTTTLAITPNPAALDQPVTLTATVAPVAPTTITPKGNVTFLDGATVVGTAKIKQQLATLVITPSQAGSRTLTARFPGDDRFAASASAGVEQVTAGPVDHPPTDLALSQASVAEDQPIGTPVGTLSATDPDAGDTQTFAFATGSGDDDNGAFQISGTALQTNAAVDFETKASYSILVSVTDTAGATAEQAFTITVTDVDEAPGAVDDTASVDKLSGATTIDVLANDTNPFGGALSIASVTQPANGTVAITHSGADLTYTPNPRYCNAGPSPTAPDTFTYTLDGGSTATVSMTVNPRRVPPVAIDPVRLIQSAGTTRERLVTNDEDPVANKLIALLINRFDASGYTDPFSCAPGTETLDYHWVISYPAITPYVDFGINGYSGPVLTMDQNSLLNQAAPPVRFILTVTSRASGLGVGREIWSNVGQSALNIAIFNQCQGITPGTCSIAAAGPENVAPTDIALSNASVVEHQPAGTTVGTLSATDPNSGDTQTFSLVAGTGDDDNVAFLLSGTTLATNAVFDAETKASYSIRVRVTDLHGLPFEEAVTVTVTADPT